LGVADLGRVAELLIVGAESAMSKGALWRIRTQIQDIHILSSLCKYTRAQLSYSRPVFFQFCWSMKTFTDKLLIVCAVSAMSQKALCRNKYDPHELKLINRAFYRYLIVNAESTILGDFGRIKRDLSLRM